MRKHKIKLKDQEFIVECRDGVEGLNSLEDGSVKLIYGSPPYPNAVRDYGCWKSEEYIEKISPFIDAAVRKLSDDGFIVINVKANRERAKADESTRRSLVIERLAILMEEKWHLHCVDIEIWVKENPVPTGLRVACQDAYEQNLWFSKSKKWTLNIDAIRKPYSDSSLERYRHQEYKPRTNGVPYVRRTHKIEPNPDGALPINVISGSVSGKVTKHQAVQPNYLPDRYILACTSEGDLVVDPWLGSGTTGVSALQLNRKFIGFDLFNQFVEIASNNLKECINVRQIIKKED